MSHLSHISSFVLLASSLAALSACEIGTEKRVLPQDDSALVSYFFSDQYAINETAYRDYFSFFFGAVIVADPSSNMELWTNPPSGCFRTSDFGIVASQNVAFKRRLDAGNLRMETLPGIFSSLNKDRAHNYYFSDALAPGAHSLRSPGLKNGALKFELPFDVLEKGGGIKVYTFLEPGENATPTEQPLASPDIPAPGDSNHNVVFNRLSNNVISYNAPAGTDYVRLRLRDGSNTPGSGSRTPDGDITCFAKPDEPLVVPLGALYGFRAGPLGHLELDFVTSSQIKDVAKLKLGTVISTMRHIQGSWESVNQEGISITLDVGLIEFR